MFLTGDEVCERNLILNFVEMAKFEKAHLWEDPEFLLTTDHKVIAHLMDTIDALKDPAHKITTETAQFNLEFTENKRSLWELGVPAPCAPYARKRIQRLHTQVPGRQI